MFTILASSATKWTENYGTVSEQLNLGFIMMLVGVAVVMALLVVIMIAIEFLPLLFGDRSHKKNKKAEKEPAPVVEATAAPAPASAAAEGGVIAAVIAAALAAYTSETPQADAAPGAGFRVRRIRRVQ